MSNEKSNICDYEYCKYKNRTPFATPAVQIGIYIVSIFVISITIEPTHNFSVALLLLALPLLAYNASEIPPKKFKLRRAVRSFLVVISFLYLIIPGFLLLGIFEYLNYKDGYFIVFNRNIPDVGGVGFPIVYVWRFAMLIVGTMIIDAFLVDRLKDKEVRSEMKKEFEKEVNGVG